MSVLNAKTKLFRAQLLTTASAVTRIFNKVNGINLIKGIQNVIDYHKIVIYTEFFPIIEFAPSIQPKEIRQLMLRNFKPDLFMQF